MGKGRIYHDPQFRYADQFSGREIMQLTKYLGNSSHLYFTDPAWIIPNQEMIFTSDRENQSNLFKITFDGGEITQLTYLEGYGRPGGCYSAANRKHYFWWQGEIHELDINSLEERIIYRLPEGMSGGGRANPTADGKYICTRINKQPEEKQAAISFSYSRFHEFFHAKPFTQIIRVEVTTGEVDVIHEDNCYMGHINTSPVLPDIMTFCHEGPWAMVDQRIWGLNIQTGDTWRIRAQDMNDPNDVAIGHEYWFSDGIHIGYHGRPRERHGEHIFGWRRWDDTEATEVRFPFASTHFHSLDENLIVGDGSPAFVFTSESKARPYIQLFKWDAGEGRYVGPRILAYHRSTFNNQHAHPHPRFTPDGRHIIYNSDLTSYSNIYKVPVGDFDTLPPVE